MSTHSLPNLDLSSTFGVVFWGFLISAVLLGVSLVQGYLYYSNNSDTWLMKGLVSTVLLAISTASSTNCSRALTDHLDGVLDAAGTMLVAESMHHYLIKNFGNPFALLEMAQSFIAEYFLSVILILLSQLFYASRIYNARKHNHGRYVGLMVASFAIISFAVAYELLAIDRLISNLASPKMKKFVIIYNFSAALCDIMATSSMCYFLSSQKTPFKATKSILKWLFFFSINRGFLVCATQIALVSAYLACPSKAYWMPFHISLSKLHVNTLMAMLNSRPILRSQLQGRVNYVGGSNSSMPDRYVSPVRLQSATDAERTEETYKYSVGKKLPLTPRRLTQSEMQTSQPLTSSDEANEFSGVELRVIDIVKAPSIV